MSEMKPPDSSNTPMSLNEVAKDYSIYKSIDWQRDPAGEQFLHLRFSEHELAVFEYANNHPAFGDMLAHIAQVSEATDAMPAYKDGWNPNSIPDAIYQEILRAPVEILDAAEKNVLGAWAAARGAEAFPDQPLLQRDFAQAVANFTEGLLSIGEGYKGAEENRDYRPGDPFMPLHGTGERGPMGPDVPAAPGLGTPGATSYREERIGSGEDQEGRLDEARKEPGATVSPSNSAEPGPGPDPFSGPDGGGGSGLEPGPGPGPGPGPDPFSGPDGGGGSGLEPGPGPDPFSGPASFDASQSEPDPFAGQTVDLAAAHVSALMQAPDPFAGQASALSLDPFTAAASSADPYALSPPSFPSDVTLSDAFQSINSDVVLQEAPDPSFSAGDGIGMPVIHSWLEFMHAQGR